MKVQGKVWVGFAWYTDDFEGIPPCITHSTKSEDDCARKLERQIDRVTSKDELIEDKWEVEYRTIKL